MANLDNIEEIKALDPKDVFGSTGLFLKQCRQIHQLFENFSLPESYLPVYNVVYSGMGGSALGAQVVSHLYKTELKEPLLINNDYTLPGFVDKDTLVILSSYSGGTEETLTGLEEAKKKGAKIVGFTTGGKLKQMLEAENLPGMFFDPTNNPSGQPRLGTGYFVIGTIELLRKAGVLDVDNAQIENAIESLESQTGRIQNEAKVLAFQIQGKIPVIMAADHLVGCAHVLRNQFNETAKSFSAYSPIPELNHHLMEGLKNPQDKHLVALLIESDLYPEKLKTRCALTEDVVKQNHLQILKYQPKSADKLSQALEMLIFGGYLTFYLAMLYEQDPSLIPWVDYFKTQLASKS